MNFKEFFLERYGRQRKLEGLWYHGTSAKFLSSILKHGLLVNTKEKSWDEDTDASMYSVDRTSYGGVYITNNLNIASGAAFRIAHKTNNNKLLVIMNIQPKTLVSDEDDFTHDFTSFDSIDNATHNYKTLKYDSPNGVLPREIEKDKQKWIQQKIKKITWLLPNNHPKLIQHLTELLQTEGWEAVITRITSHISNDQWEYLWDYQTPTGNIPPKPSTKEGEGIFRNFIDKLTRILKQNPVKGSSTGRSLSNIGFKGTNKIKAIVEISNNNRNLIIHWGQLPTEFTKDYIRQIDSDITIQDKDGNTYTPPNAHQSI